MYLLDGEEHLKEKKATSFVVPSKTSKFEGHLRWLSICDFSSGRDL